jgi:hypothetical protein
VLYVGTPSTPQVREAMTAGEIGCMLTPAQFNVLPEGAWHTYDNGCAPDPDTGQRGRGWPGEVEWWAWLSRSVDRFGVDRCLFAVAPDVPFDAAATLAESSPWLARIRSLGVPAAFVAQDGAEAGRLVPWPDLDVLFLGGSVAWKLSAAARSLVRQAHEFGKRVHMGKVSSQKRILYAAAIGCDTADGTYLRFAPDLRLTDVRAWNRALAAPALLDVRRLQA